VKRGDENTCESAANENSRDADEDRSRARTLSVEELAPLAIQGSEVSSELLMQLLKYLRRIISVDPKVMKQASVRRHICLWAHHKYGSASRGLPACDHPSRVQFTPALNVRKGLPIQVVVATHAAKRSAGVS
jgi:hypothetical protein